MRMDSSTTALSFAMTGAATTEIHFAMTGKAGGGGKRPSVWERRHEALCRLRAAGLPLIDSPSLDCFDEGYEEGFTPPKALREGYEDLRRQAEESLRTYEEDMISKDNDDDDDVTPSRSHLLPAVILPLDSFTSHEGWEEKKISRKKRRVHLSDSLHLLEDASMLSLLQKSEEGQEAEEEEEECFYEEIFEEEGDGGAVFEEVRLTPIPEEEEEEEDEELGGQCNNFIHDKLNRAADLPCAGNL